VSKRKNGFILFLILVLCLLLLSQLMGDTLQFEPGNADLPEEAGLVPPAGTAASAEPVEMNAVVFSGPEEFRLLGAWNEAYEREHPGTRVNIVNIEKRQAVRYLLEQAEAGTSPDIMLLDNLWVNYFAALGLLTHAVEASAPERPAALPEAESRLVWNGYVWAVPRDFNPYVIVINKPLMEEAGFAELPADAAGWLEVYRGLADRGYDAGVGIDAQDPGAFIAAVLAMGGDWEAGESGMIRIEADSLPVLEALVGPADPGGDPADLKTLLRLLLEGANIWQQFAEKRLAAAVVPLSEWILNGPGQAAVAASLTEGGARKLWAGGTSFAVSSSSDHAAEAFAWISAMTRTERLLDLLPVTGALPSYPSALESARVRALPQWDAVGPMLQLPHALPADPLNVLKLGTLGEELETWSFGEAGEPGDWNERLERRWQESW